MGCLIYAAFASFFTVGFIIAVIFDARNGFDERFLKIIVGGALILFLLWGNTYRLYRNLRRKDSKEYLDNKRWIKEVLNSGMEIDQALGIVAQRYTKKLTSSGLDPIHGSVIVHDLNGTETQARVIEKNGKLKSAKIIAKL